MNRVNDFAFKIATANGTGSASANGLIMQAIFRMGVPVTGKNVFPSNIQGLPTWYEIRVSKHGYSARTPEFDLMVALNAATYAKDVAEVRSGGWLLYDSSWPLDDKLHRPDVTYVGVPLAEMCNAAFKGVRERILMKNIAYAGALAALLQMDADMIRQLLKEKFGRKPALMDSNQKAMDLGYGYASANFQCPLPIKLEKMDATKDFILIDGNTAAGLGCVYAGATVGAWYPITPATSLMEAFRNFCQKYRVDPETKKNRFCVVQAEDELAAAGVVIGAGWAGARAFTPTSGPGISLMNEPGTTRPREAFSSMSSPIWLAALRASSTSPRSSQPLLCCEWCAHTPARQSACSSTRTDSAFICASLTLPRMASTLAVMPIRFCTWWPTSCAMT